jgi:ABC-type oligopeptide transport system ATPase subunit
MKEFLKSIMGIALVGVIAFALISAFGYVGAHKEAWEMESVGKAHIELNHYDEQLRNAEARSQIWTGILQAAAVLFVLGGITCLGIHAWKVVDERQEARNRMVEGSYALQQYKGANGERWTVDPNKQVFGAVGFRPMDGQLITDASIVGADRQLELALSIQKGRNQAATPVSDIRNSAQAKLASGYYDKPVKPAVRMVEETPMLDDSVRQVESWQPLSLTDAFHQSTPDNWILGQNERGPFNFSIKESQHVGILGASGTGKTSGTGVLMMLNALKSRFHVIALDGKDGIDWMCFKDYIEVYPTNDQVISEQVDAIYRQYKSRMKNLAIQEVDHYSKLDVQVKPIMVIMEEFGNSMDTLKVMDSGAHAATEAQFSEMFRMSRAAGIHLVLIDQLMDGWPKVLKANTKGVIAYWVGGQQGAAFNAHKLHELAEQGQFWSRDRVYDAWHTKPDAPKLLATVKPSATKYLTLTATRTSTDEEAEGGGMDENTPPLSYQYVPDDVPVRDDLTGVNEGGTRTDTRTSTGRRRRTSALSVPVRTDSGTPPLMDREPTTANDMAFVYSYYVRNNYAKNETLRQVFGAMTPKTRRWLDSAIQSQEVKQ